MRQVFFSFHYKRDVWRAAQIRNMQQVDKGSTFCDNDWEEVRFKTSSKIKEWIDSQLAMRSCIVVLVGAETSTRDWVKYEIQKAMELRKGIVGIRINRLENKDKEQDIEGANPFYNIITNAGDRLSKFVTLFEPTNYTSTGVYKEIKERLSGLIEEAISNRNLY